MLFSFADLIRTIKDSTGPTFAPRCGPNVAAGLQDTAG
jgi:hypothetical protein